MISVPSVGWKTCKFKFARLRDLADTFGPGRSISFKIREYSVFDLRNGTPDILSCVVKQKESMRLEAHFTKHDAARGLLQISGGAEHEATVFLKLAMPAITRSH